MRQLFVCVFFSVHVHGCMICLCSVQHGCLLHTSEDPSNMPKTMAQSKGLVLI